MNRRLTNIIGILIIFIVQLSIFSEVYGQDKIISSVVDCKPGKLTIKAEKVPWSILQKEIRDKCQITITGMEGRGKELITFSSTGDIEDVFKRLFKQLNEKNFAFEYSKIGINRISVVPEGKATASLPNAPMNENPSLPMNENIPPTPPVNEPAVQQPPQPAISTAVQVINVNEGTQAQKIGLKQGDMIIEYDGVKITDTQQLVEEVKNKASRGSVDMVILRNNEPMRVSASGGTIGVNISNSALPSLPNAAPKE